MTHRKGEEETTAKIEKAKKGDRYLVIVGKNDVISRKLKPRSRMIQSMEKRK